jgi:hypothetical protein
MSRYSPTFSALDGAWRLTSRPSRKIGPCSLNAGLDAPLNLPARTLEKRNIFCTCPKTAPVFSVDQPVAPSLCLVKDKVILRPTVSRSVSLGVKSHLGPKTNFFFLLPDIWGFFDAERPLWGEDESLICQGSFYRVWFQWETWPYFTVSDSRVRLPGGPDPRIYISQEQGACSLVAEEATAVVLPPVHTTVTWQWVYMSRHQWLLN